MNKLLKVKYDNDRITVSARELHDFLEVKTAYKDWFPRMCGYGFREGEDFCSFLSESDDCLQDQYLFLASDRLTICLLSISL